MGELGVFVKNGEICFRPDLLRPEEFLTAPGEFKYYDVSGVARRLVLKAGELAFTYCQVLIVYRMARENSLVMVPANGTRLRSSALQLDPAISRLIFERAGKVLRLEVSLAL